MIKHPIIVISQGQKNVQADMVIVVVTVVMEIVYIHTQILQTLSSYFFS